MPRVNGSPADVGGSGKEVKLIDDLGSEVVREVVEQLNRAEVVTTKTISTGVGTARAILGRWREDMWVKDISIGNTQAVDFVSATTVIALKHTASTDANMYPPGPQAATTLFSLTGFLTDTFAGPQTLWDDEFIEGTNVTTRTGGSDVLVPAGETLYAEFVNGESGARNLEFNIVLASTDKITLQPHGMNNPYHARTRNRRKNRQS